jgi:hypothetical protein
VGKCLCFIGCEFWEASLKIVDERFTTSFTDPSRKYFVIQSPRKFQANQEQEFLQDHVKSRFCFATMAGFTNRLNWPPMNNRLFALSKTEASTGPFNGDPTSNLKEEE